MMKTAVLTAGALMAVATATAAVERVDSYFLNMPADVYKSMSVAERTCAGRAMKALESGNFRSAASEWSRFDGEFVATASEDVLAWASFFKAFGFYKAKDVNKAIELFSEMHELYPDSGAVCQTLFFRGQAYCGNGDLTKGLADYRELVDDDRFAAHPLAYTAHNRLAWSAMNRRNVAEAEAEWQAVVNLKQSGNRDAWTNARVALDQLNICRDPASGFAEVAEREVFGDSKEDAKARCVRMAQYLSWLFNSVRSFEGMIAQYCLAQTKGNEKKARSMAWGFRQKLLDGYEKSARPAYAAAGDEWAMELTLLGYRSELEPKAVSKAVDDIAVKLRQVSDPAERQRRAVATLRKLGEIRRVKEGKLLLDTITDPVSRAFAGAELGWAVRDGKLVAESLEPIENHADTATADRAKRGHADACRELLSEYDKAIKLYEEAPEPPATLWRIAECHRMAGRKAQAQTVLDEICSMFPNDAASAMLRKGDWYSADGDKKKAIGCFRRIMAHQDWKKSGAASQAHQRLEAFGIATGGAVLNDVH